MGNFMIPPLLTHDELQGYPTYPQMRPRINIPPLLEQMQADAIPPNIPNIPPQIATPPIMQDLPTRQYIPQGNIPITMAPASPAEAGIEQLKAPVYGSPEFHNSKLRTVLNAIAGGLAGASGGAEVGMDVGSRLHDSKYLDAMSRYKGTLADLKEKKNVEEARFGRTEKEMSESRLRDATASLSTYRAGELGLKGDELERKRALDAEREKHWARLDENSKKKILDYEQKLPEYRLKWWHDLSPEQQDEYAGLNLAEHPASSPQNVADKEQARIDVRSDPKNLPKEAEIAKATGEGHIIAGGTAPALAAEKGKAQATEAGKISAQEAADSKTASALADQALANPDGAWDVAKMVPPHGKAAFWSKLTAGNPIIPKQITDVTVKTAIVNAQTALKHANSLEKLIADPDIQKSIGPIAGRITEGGQIVGKSVYNSGPAAQKEAQFLGLLRYLVTFEASSTSGTRPSWQLIRFLQGTSPAAKMDLDKFKGALDSVKTSAANRIEAAYQPTSSGKPVVQPTPAEPGIDWGRVTIHER